MHIDTGPGLTGMNYTVDGDGNKLEAKPIPNTFDRLALLTDWVEKGTAPGKSVKVTGGEKSRPMSLIPSIRSTSKDRLRLQNPGHAARADRSIRRNMRREPLWDLGIDTS